MKKTFFIAVLIFLCTVCSYGVETAKCVLQHKGNVTMFDASAITSALDAAVDGDTLFLTEGAFSGFTLTKQVTVRGAGEYTQISGTVTISIPNSPTLTQTLLEGLYLTGDVNLTTEMNGVKIKQCRFAVFDVDKANDNIIIDRCFISSKLSRGSYIKGFTAINSKIKEIDGYDTNPVYNFVNCNIWEIYNPNSNAAGTFSNSIIYTSYYSNGYVNCALQNTLHHDSWKMDSSSHEENCYYDSSLKMESSTMEPSYDEATLRSKGYLGNDGTVVGCYGGTTPFTLELEVPKVTESTIKLDTANKALNVTMKVSAK